MKHKVVIEGIIESNLTEDEIKDFAYARVAGYDLKMTKIIVSQVTE